MKTYYRKGMIKSLIRAVNNGAALIITTPFMYACHMQTCTCAAKIAEHVTSVQNYCVREDHFDYRRKKAREHHGRAYVKEKII